VDKWKAKQDTMIVQKDQIVEKQGASLKTMEMA